MAGKLLDDKQEEKINWPYVKREYEKGASLSSLSKDYGVSPSCIRSHLFLEGTKFRSRGGRNNAGAVRLFEAKGREEIEKLLKSHSVSHLSKHVFECSETTFRNFLRKHNIRRRYVQRTDSEGSNS